MRRNYLPILLLTSCMLMWMPVRAQLAKGKCKFLGSIIGSSAPSDFKMYWNQVTPENGGKWGSVERTRDAMSWTALDLAYNAAKSNDLLFKEHTLVWGQQQPSWISGLPAEEQKEEVEEWISGFCQRYPKTDLIDVVNEPLHAVPTYAAALGGSGSTGWDWVIWSFEKARQYCPNAKLVLNDYNIIKDDAATGKYLEIIKLLKDRGLIDIVGEQGHFLETVPGATIKHNLDRLGAMDLPVHITEYDVNLADDDAQKAKYQEQFPILWTHPAVHGVTLWGYKEGQIWRKDAYLVRSNATARPALAWLSTFVGKDQGGTFCNPVTGMREEDDRSMEVYPSPAMRGEFVVDAGGRSCSVKILNAQGQMKKQFNVSGQPVAVHLKEAAGVYFLQLSDGRHTRFRKIILN